MGFSVMQLQLAIGLKMECRKIKRIGRLAKNGR